MKTILSTLLILTWFSSLGQQQMAEYPGGVNALHQYIRQELIYPKLASDYGIEGNVRVAFVVDTTGAVSNVEVLKGIGGGCDEEAIRVIQNIPERFSPAIMRGYKIRFRTSIDIKFSIASLTVSNIKERFNDISQSNPNGFRDYEGVMLDATNYILTHSTILSSELIDALEIFDKLYSLNPDLNIPTQCQFFRELHTEEQKTYYEVAMVNYILLNRKNGKDLSCIQIQDHYLGQSDVQEVQLEGAKNLLHYMLDKWNHLTPPKSAKKYYKAMAKGRLSIEAIQQGL